MGRVGVGRTRTGEDHNGLENTGGDAAFETLTETWKPKGAAHEGGVALPWDSDDSWTGSLSCAT